jgi:hypothetical protein
MTKPVNLGACPKCGNGVWDGPKYTTLLERKDVTTVGNAMDWLAYTCAYCRYVRYEAPLDRQGAVDTSPRRRDEDEKECRSESVWVCEREKGHTGKHMAWKDYDTRTLYDRGEWV